MRNRLPVNKTLHQICFQIKAFEKKKKFQLLPKKALWQKLGTVMFEVIIL